METQPVDCVSIMLFENLQLLMLRFGYQNYDICYVA